MMNRVFKTILMWFGIYDIITQRYIVHTKGATLVINSGSQLPTQVDSIAECVRSTHFTYRKRYVNKWGNSVKYVVYFVDEYDLPEDINTKYSWGIPRMQGYVEDAMDMVKCYRFESKLY